MKKYLKILSVFSIIMLMFSTIFAGEMIDYSIDEDICRFSDYFNEENTLPYIRISGGRMEVDTNVLKSGMAFADGNIEVKEEMKNVQILTSSDTIKVTGSIENAILLAPQVIIDGEVTGTVAILSSSISLGENSNVKGDILACTSDFKVKGKITRNVILIAENVTVEEGTEIIGSLRFQSNMASISKDAIITGKVYCKSYSDVNVSDEQKDYVQIIKLEEIEKEDVSMSRFFKKTIPFLKIVVSSLIFAGIYLLIFINKNVIHNVNEKLDNKSYIVLLIGLGFIFVIPMAIILCTILAIMGLGSISGPLFIALIAILLLSITLRIFVIGIIIIEMMLSSKYSNKLESKVSKFVFATIVFITLYLLEYIPFIGSLVSYLYLMITTGYICVAFLPKKNKEKNSNIDIIETK